MALPEEKELLPELLYLFVIGPGTGETVLLRVPPDRWLIIDSFQSGRPGRPAAESILSKYGGVVLNIVLTHPHMDHYRGVIELIDRHAEAVLGCVHPNDGGQTGPYSADPVAALGQGAKVVYTRIAGEWEANPARRWDTFRGTWQEIGEAKLTSLHPNRPVNRAQWSADQNKLSSAMLVEWHDLRILLGADVPNTEWPGIVGAFAGLNDHAAMKVPHHGSREAIHESFGDGRPERFWVITPFTASKLPSAADIGRSGEPEGLRLALSFVNEVRLTSLPFRHALEFQDPCSATRAQVRDGTHPPRTLGSHAPANASPTELDRQIVVAFDRGGRIVQEWYGRGSARITR